MKDQIRQLLVRTDATYAEIGQRFGVTRQRVEQIAKEWGISGRARKRKRIDRKLEVQLRHPPGRLGKLQAHVKKLGLTLTPSIRPGETNKQRVSTRLFSLAGGKCCLKLASLRKGSVVLHGVQGHRLDSAEFVIVDFRGTYFVFPARTYPKKMTEFKMAIRHPERLTHTRRHDYRQYFEAWGLLGEPCPKP